MTRGFHLQGFPGGSAGKESTCCAGDPSLTPVRKIRWRRDRLPVPIFLGFLGDSAGKEFTCNVRDPWVWSLGWEDLLEKEKATDSSILAWSDFHFSSPEIDLSTLISYKMKFPRCTGTCVQFVSWDKLQNENESPNNSTLIGTSNLQQMCKTDKFRRLLYIDTWKKIWKRKFQNHCPFNLLNLLM